MGSSLDNSARGLMAPALVFIVAVFFVGLGCERGGTASSMEDKAGDPWTAGQVLEVEHLAGVVSSPDKPKPLILYVGPAVLYRKAHIPGALNIGPAAEPNGEASLRKAVQPLAKDTELILYCGCCPWNVCPNVRPAVRLLKGMGFTRVKVLSIPRNFTLNWVKKGLPVETGN